MVMYPNYNSLARSFKIGCLCTVVLQALSLALGGYIFSDWRLCALGLPLGHKCPVISPRGIAVYES
jgi:hypothetical protein